MDLINRLDFEEKKAIQRWVIMNLNTFPKKIKTEEISWKGQINIVKDHDLLLIKEMNEKKDRDLKSGRLVEWKDFREILKDIKSYEKNEIPITSKDINIVKEKFPNLPETDLKELAKENKILNISEGYHLSYDFKEISDYEIEAFASPLNNILKKYCSVFLRDQTLFGQHKGGGCLGTFQKLDLVGKSVYINPPFIDTILVDAAKKVRSALAQKKGTRILFVGPTWKDSEYHIILSRNEFLKEDRYVKGEIEITMFFLEN